VGGGVGTQRARRCSGIRPLVLASRMLSCGGRQHFLLPRSGFTSSGRGLYRSVPYALARSRRRRKGHLPAVRRRSCRCRRSASSCSRTGQGRMQQAAPARDAAHKFSVMPKSPTQTASRSPPAKVRSPSPRSCDGNPATICLPEFRRVYLNHSLRATLGRVSPARRGICASICRTVSIRRLFLACMPSSQSRCPLLGDMH